MIFLLWMDGILWGESGRWNFMGQGRDMMEFHGKREKNNNKKNINIIIK